ncbi:MAG TPA: hypothetical protein VGM49_05735 [Candidatus Limnocylindrales bacterium]|jgi:hypothetical protein
MIRKRRSGIAAAAAAGLLLALAVGTASAASPKAQFAFTICQTQVDGFDGDGNPIGPIPAIELLYTWSGANVNLVSGAWTRSDGQEAGFASIDGDFPPGKSGSADAGSLTVLSDPGFDGLVGAFYWHNHAVSTQHIAEPLGGWTSVAAC